MAEVCYVLEGLYQVSREDIADNFRKLSFDVTILNVDVFLRALEIFDKPPKLDFVDCLLYGYKMERGIDIVTFDILINKKNSQLWPTVFIILHSAVKEETVNTFYLINSGRLK